ncbi:MAG: hypothetical protein Q8R64_16260, partial [Sulfurimicrobium sp.]|nr:hypothetical protein [Sulfurimicrobium sp.]
RELLGHAGKISAENARAKAEAEYDRYRALVDALPRSVDADFELATRKLKEKPAAIEKKTKRKGDGQ